MLELDSPRWAMLRSSPGFSGELARQLLRELRDGAGANRTRRGSASPVGSIRMSISWEWSARRSEGQSCIHRPRNSTRRPDGS